MRVATPSRFAVATSDVVKAAGYRQARRRVAEYLGWVYGMNDSIDFAALFAKNVRQLQTYLSDPLPLSDDRLFARRSHEEMLKKLNCRAQARDVDPSASEPRYRALFEAFVEQNLEAETLSRQREKMAAYEQGRTLMSIDRLTKRAKLIGRSASRISSWPAVNDRTDRPDI